ncbi:MAG: M20/M25/M40 family metallo-hydrolase [Bacteroidales bacterium]|nr:M20/M25/M40 family metallo-hydrolase [Bacteroidales bacterium]
MIDYKEIRHQLHEHPQTAGNEQFAHDLIVRHLQSLHPTKVYTHVGGYGVVAVWETKDSSNQTIKQSNIPTIAFRADIDALPIGHRCGHDGHTTILLRLAELIDEKISTLTSSSPLHFGKESKLSLRSTFGAPNFQSSILLLFQPAEETGTGSRAVLDTGILQQYDIRAIYALHNLPGYPLGTVVLCPHTFAAASTGVVYRLDGRETHASTPELGINPGLAVAEIINRFDGFNEHSLKQSSIQSFRQSTLICVRVGQPAFGTSAGHGEVMFTLRAFTNDAMERLLADANNAVDEIAGRYGLTVSRSLVEPFRATENHPDCVKTIEKAAHDMPLNVVYKDIPNRWSEDFAEYLMKFPGAMFGIGSGEHQPELHHPSYDFPDELIEPAAQFFFRLTL